MQFDSIHRRFAAQAQSHPHAVAVSMNGERLTYRDLDERSDRIARILLDRGIEPESPVAVMMERSLNLIVSILGIVKAGACYLPVHESHPVDRVRRMLEDTGCSVILTGAPFRHQEIPQADHVVVVDDELVAGPPISPPVVDTHPDQLAYVIHTSGSTGDPKGVAVTHGGVLDLVAEPAWDSPAHQRVLMVAPHAFDVSTYEIWVPLLRGGHLVLAPPGSVDVATLRRAVREHDITAVHLTAGLFRLIAEEAPQTLHGVREVMTGGDVVAPSAVRRVLDVCPHATVRALYGPTETTLFATHTTITEPYVPSASVPIGRPMRAMRVYLLDERLRPVAPGETGEIYIAGTGVARGYVGRPDLTAERFVADPFTADGQRMYRSGDIGRSTATGEIDFLGRVDDQVKIRGYRVEPAEVAAAVTDFPGVRDSVVLVREPRPGDKRLTAYLVATEAAIDTTELRTYLHGRLPEYMVPDTVVSVDSLPLTVNGKVDRDALERTA